MRAGIVTAVTIFLGLASGAQAVNYSNEVLAIGVGARALGMGGAFVSMADDSTSVYWNPAGLAKVPHIEISAIQQGRQYSGLSLNEVGSRYIFTSGAMSLPRIGSFGVAFMRFGVDDIPYVPAGVPLNADGSPVQQGTFQTQDMGVMASYGKKFHPAFSAGITAKYLSGGTSGLKWALGDASYNYTGADLGVQVDFGGFNPSFKGLNFGLNLQDVVNTGYSWHNTPTNPTDAVDLNPKVGISYSPQLQFLKNSDSVLSVAFDADPKYGSNTLYHFGGEFWYKDTLAFRGGFRDFAGGMQSLETTLGASFKLYILQVDYAFINYELTPIHYLSLAVKF